jgi:hypothetical protein
MLNSANEKKEEISNEKTNVDDLDDNFSGFIEHQ